MNSFIIHFDKALKVISGLHSSIRSTPALHIAEEALSSQERRHSAGLMRVNHVGEVCAQALYEAQGQFARSYALKAQFTQAMRDEEDHLAWTAQRLQELGAKPSLLNPIWYAGAFALGALAARIGDAESLGFVVETEQQVEAHLESHMLSLPQQDGKSRAIVDQMRMDEIEHGAKAKALGAVETPLPIRIAMKMMAKVMTTTAYYI